MCRWRCDTAADFLREAERAAQCPRTRNDTRRILARVKRRDRTLILPVNDGRSKYSKLHWMRENL
jgi:hypothetical protein